MSDADELAIGRLLVRYATAIDRRDWTLLRSCFIDDVRADYGSFGSWDSAEGLCAFMADIHASMGPTIHRISNIAVEGTAARSYVEALLMAADGSAQRAEGYYDDELVTSAGEWRISKRTYNHVRLSEA